MLCFLLVGCFSSDRDKARHFLIELEKIYSFKGRVKTIDLVLESKKINDLLASDFNFEITIRNTKFKFEKVKVLTDSYYLLRRLVKSQSVSIVITNMIKDDKQRLVDTMISVIGIENKDNHEFIETIPYRFVLVETSDGLKWKSGMNL